MSDDSEQEIPLTGGRSTAAGRPRRRHRAPSHRAVVARRARLLGHLGRPGSPGRRVALGVDEHGRDVLQFIEGEVLAIPQDPFGDLVLGRWPDPWRSDEALAAAGGLLRGLHDAARGFRTEHADWRLLRPRDAGRGDHLPRRRRALERRLPRRRCRSPSSTSTRLARTRLCSISPRAPGTSCRSPMRRPRGVLGFDEVAYGARLARLPGRLRPRRIAAGSRGPCSGEGARGRLPALLAARARRHGLLPRSRRRRSCAGWPRRRRGSSAHCAERIPLRASGVVATMQT